MLGSTALSRSAESNLAGSAQYNSFLGLNSITGPNASTAAFTYDSMARPSTTTSPYGAVTTYAYSNRSGTTLGTSTATTNGKWARTTVDGLGRTVKVERGYGTTVVSIVVTVYAPCACSAVGKVQKVSQPYAPGGTVYWTQYEYDARGRTTKVTPPLNAGYTSYVYAGNTVKVIDPAGRYKIHTLDVIGNLKKVSEKNPAGGADLDTFYTYNLADKLTQVSMTRGTTTQLRIFTYDSAFRLETERHPETGLTTYTYDSQGRVSTKVDAKSQKVEYVYDAYGRVTMVKRYPVSTGAEDLAQRTTNTYDYDPGGGSSETRHLWGRLAAVKTGEYGWTERYSYTSSGLLAKKTTEFLSNNGFMQPTVSYSYDNEGKVTQMAYPQYGRETGQFSYEIFPDRMALTYTYNSMGQLQGIVSSASNPAVGLGGGAIYNAAGQLTSLTRPNAEAVDPVTDLPAGASGGATQETFEYNGRNQLTRQTFGYGDVHYQYSTTANDGRLTQKKIWNLLSQSGDEENYTYDSLGRLATAYTTGPAWGLSWTYDGFGNRTQQSVTKGTAPSSSQPVDPLTNRLSGSGITYDLNGNQTGWTTPLGPVTLSYDVENRMSGIQTPDTTESYKYGPGNLRVIKQMPYETWYSVYGKDGELLGTYKGCSGGGIAFLCEARLRVYFGGKLILNGWQGVTPDHLGSPMDVHGRIYPYGEAANPSSTDQDETYTTYKRDRSTGLDYAMNRYYSAAWGRFTTADPYRATSKSANNPQDPQSWNRYTYVEGDPVNLVDPFGLQAAAETDGQSCKWEWDNIWNSFGCLGSGSSEGVVTFTSDVTATPDPSPAYEPIGSDPSSWDWLPQGPGESSGSSEGGGARGGGTSTRQKEQILPCLGKGIAVGAAGAAVVGLVAVGAVTIGAPVAVVTGVLGVASVIGGASTIYDGYSKGAAGDWAGAAYDVGPLIGASLVGGAGGRGIRTGMTGETSGWSWAIDWSHRFRSDYPGGSFGKWIGTGPNIGSAGGSAATTGAGLGQLISGGC